MENFSYYQSFEFEEPELSSSSPGSHTPAYEKVIVDNQKTYKCLAEKCEKSFRFKSDMERHVIVHTKERPFVCKYSSCSKTFKRPDALKNHMQVHNEGFPFACNVPGCNLRFHKKSALQYHALTHNEEKFLCNVPGCQKSFITWKHLKQHQNTTTCHQKFITASSQKDSNENDCDCFLNHFEDLVVPESDMSVAYMSTKHSFDQEEEFSSKSEKFLHTEGGRATACQSAFEDSSKICKSSECSKLRFKDFVQLMICKYLLDENQQMKAKFDIKTDPLKAKYERNLSLMLKKALNNQFDMNDNS